MNVTEVILPTAQVSVPRCSVCLNYLSQQVVTMLRDGSPICAPCQPRALANNEVYESACNVLVKHCKFKCRNFYSGCSQMVFGGSDHEMYCHENIVCCPRCVYVGNGGQLEYHFENCHPDYLINDDFHIQNRNGFTEVFLYRNDEYMFSIYVVIENDVLKVKAINMFKHPKLHQYHFQLISELDGAVYIYKSDGDFLDKKDIHKYLLVNLYKLADYFKEPLIKCRITVMNNAVEEIDDLRETSIVIKSMVEDLDKYHRTLDEEIEALRTENRMLTETIIENSLGDSNQTEALQKFIQMIAPSILVCTSCRRPLSKTFNVCPRNHPVCSRPTCLTGVCKKCEKVTEFTSNDRLAKLMIPCDWEGCDLELDFSKYIVHKQQCSYRLYKCPQPPCNFIATLPDFKQHWHYVKPGLELGACVRFQAGQKNEFYWITPQHQEFIHIKISKVSAMETKIRVDERHVVFGENYDIKLYAQSGKIFKFVDTLEQHGQYKVLKFKHSAKHYKLIVEGKA